ncbi:MAG: hypothetical protein WCI73_01695 [Phycisphaerae bacterium]
MPSDDNTPLPPCDLLPEGDPRLYPLLGSSGQYALFACGCFLEGPDIAREEGIELSGPSEGEVIMRLVERAAHPAMGMATAIGRCWDWPLAMALFDVRRHVVWLTSSQEVPLFLTKLRTDNRWFWATDDWVLRDGLKYGLGSKASTIIEKPQSLEPESIIGISWDDGSLIHPSGIHSGSL